jgi:hypothetical protein
MANHGQLLEYSLEPVPDHTLSRDKVDIFKGIDVLFLVQKYNLPAVLIHIVFSDMG